jgi:hypothetical protein
MNLLTLVAAPIVFARPAAPFRAWQSRWWIRCRFCQKKDSCGALPKKCSLDMCHMLVEDLLRRHPCSRPRVPEGAEPCLWYQPCKPMEG